MTNPAQNEMVANHVLSSKSLNTALAVYDAYNEIRRRVIAPFISDLKEAILGHLNAVDEGWTVEALVDARPSEDWMGKKECRLRVRRDNWPADIFVGIGADSWGPANLWFGFWGKFPEGLTERVMPHFDEHVIEGGRTRFELNPPHGWCYSFYSLFERRWELNDWSASAAIAAMYEGRTGNYHNRILDMIVRTALATDELLRPQAGAVPL
jgi:hypothetical protein